MSRRSSMLGLALVVAFACSIFTASAAAQTQRCPSFRVVLNDPAAGFPAGRYFRLNFAPRVSTLTCEDTYHLLRSYLYEPSSMKGWKVGPLIGELRGRLGKHFTKNGSKGKIGFDVFRPAPRS